MAATRGANAISVGSPHRGCAPPPPSAGAKPKKCNLLSLEQRRTFQLLGLGNPEVIIFNIKKKRRKCYACYVCYVCMLCMYVMYVCMYVCMNVCMLSMLYKYVI